MTSARARRFAAPLLALALALGAVLLTPGPAVAATLTVTSGGDTGPGTLREAIGMSGPGDEIRFDPSLTTITVSSSIVVPHGITIAGPGSGALTIAASGSSVLIVAPGVASQHVSVSGIRFDGAGVAGQALLVVPGGGERAGGVTVHDVVMEGFTAGGMYVEGVAGGVTVSGSVFRGNGPSPWAGGLAVVDVDGDVTVATRCSTATRASTAAAACSCRRCAATRSCTP